MLAIQKKYGRIRKVLSVGKERGDLLANEMGGVLAADEHTPGEVVALAPVSDLSRWRSLRNLVIGQ